MRYVETALKFLLPLTFVAYLYWFYREGIFDAAFLNRLGILLNFFAGFLVAPELIGATGMQRVETAIKNVSVVLSGISDFLTKQEKMSIQQYYGMRMLTLFVAAPVILFVTSLTSHFFNTNSTATAILVPTLYVLISLAVVLLLSAYAPYLITSLKNKDALRRALVRWGIACFIFGNLFQFISTF